MALSSPTPAGFGVATDWSQHSVVVLGAAASGLAIADVLHHLGASIAVLDDYPHDPTLDERVEILSFLGVEFSELAEGNAGPLATADLVVITESRLKSAGLLDALSARGVPVLGDLELAWQLRGPQAAPWLMIAGAEKSSMTAALLEKLLHALGIRALWVDSSRHHPLEAIVDPQGPSVLLVEASEFQLEWLQTASPFATVVTDSAPDRVHNANLARAFDNVQFACVYNAQDEVTIRMVENADVVEGARAIAFSLGAPEVSMVGLVEDIVLDRAFIEDRRTNAEEIVSLTDLFDFGDDSVTELLAALTLARTLGAPSDLLREALLSLYSPPPTNDVGAP